MHILHFFFHPDCTVGSGISPDQPKRLAGFTAGGEFHPALKIILILYTCFRCCQHLFFKRIPNLTKQQYLFARLCGLFRHWLGETRKPSRYRGKRYGSGRRSRVRALERIGKRGSRRPRPRRPKRAHGLECSRFRRLRQPEGGEEGGRGCHLRCGGCSRP